MIYRLGSENGTLQAFLEKVGIPYLFYNIHTHKFTINKLEKTCQSYSYYITKRSSHVPAFVKPRFGGSSVASKLCNSKEDFDIDMRISENPTIDFINEEPIVEKEFTVWNY